MIAIMKKFLSLIFCAALLLGVSSCSNWLDVNTDPDSPNSATATAQVRLPWIQYYYMYAAGNTNFRANLVDQMYAMASNAATNTYLVIWDYMQGHSTTSYQNWFLGGACNIQDLINAAEAIEAYHYIGAAQIVKAMGSVLMVDLFGEMPFTDAVNGASLSPVYDNGDDIYAACIALLDEGIANMSKTQPASATSLAAGDTWFDGDTQKWIKLAYGLKARWYMNMSKLGTDNVDEALKALEKAPQSVSEDLYATYTNVESASTCFTVGDAYGPNTTWDCAAWGTGQRLNRWYVNLLTNFKGTGVEDPRADKLLPSAMVNVKLNEDGSIKTYEWLRDAGVDVAEPDGFMTQNRYVAGAINAYLTLNAGTSPVKKAYAKKAILNYYPSVDKFIEGVEKYYDSDVAVITEEADTVKIAYQPGALYVNDNNPLYVEDIKYVQLRADAVYETAGLAVNDMNCYYTAVAKNSRAIGYVVGTGAFYTRPDSDNDLFLYAETCFIKAEAAMIKSDKTTAYNEYKKGIQAHFDRMNRKLTEWEGKGCCTTAKGFDVSFAYAPIPAADITAYMASDAVVQSSADITMSDIMMQKFIAMGTQYTNWNDVRKYDYWMNGKYGVVYTEMKAPALKLGKRCTFSSSESDRSFFPRRWAHSSHETNYNNANCAAAYAQYGISSCLDMSIPSIPVFWDVD